MASPLMALLPKDGKQHPELAVLIGALDPLPMAKPGESPYQSGILSILEIPKHAAVGTGISKMLAKTKFYIGNDIPENVVKYAMTTQAAIFGDYPTSKDYAPCGVFIAVFSIIAIAHLYIWLRDRMKGHKFYLSFGLGMYGLLQVIGFALRLGWSQNVTRLNTGIASLVFNIASVLIVNVMNVILAHRIFTARHPETGSASWFNAAMNLIYLLVIGVLVMAIVAQVVPYLYYLDEKHYTMCKKVVRGASVLAMLMAFCGLPIIGLAYMFKPGALVFLGNKQSKHGGPVTTISPTWIKSFGTFSYTSPPPQPRYRDQADGQGHAIRIMPVRSAEHPEAPTMASNIMLVVLSSILLTAGTAMRCASTFIEQKAVPGEMNGIFKPVCLYLAFGLFEALANILYLVARVDLRFYIPDMAKKGTGPDMEENLTDGKASPSHLEQTKSVSE
ncbi:hypothetical protein CJU90_1119 [Yarrowia sp. C11]|nr:hypothetical protein CKK34_2533 [Yarrowia sp. E02]KAG5373420.1 hypothetical protein CJU90_1119 [Yarrowia sp. C11]